MLTRFIRIQLTIFAIVSVVGLTVMFFQYLQAPTLLGVGRIAVKLQLPALGGLYEFSNVTYRGVEVGKVTDVALTPDGAVATMSLDTSPKIPADLRAEVRSISAIGENYVELLPRTDSGPYLQDGSVIPKADTVLPQPIGPTLDKVSALVESIPSDRLSALLDETFQGLDGAGFDFGSLIDSGNKLTAELDPIADRARTLVDDTRPFLESQAETADSIRTFARSLAGVTEQVAANDPEIRTLLDRGPGFAQETARLLDDLKPTLPVLLANLTSLGQVLVTYNPGLEQLLVLLPAYFAQQQSYIPTADGTGFPRGSFAIQTDDPPACTVGFLPLASIRNPADTSDIDTPDNLFCKLPQDSPIAVRGARNYPCMDKPGKRAPTVEICKSDEPYQPLAMRQHALGPGPLDPNLVSQGVAIDDRVDFGDRLYAPAEGTPLPPGALPLGTSPEGPPPPGPGPAPVPLGAADGELPAGVGTGVPPVAPPPPAAPVAPAAGMAPAAPVAPEVAPPTEAPHGQGAEVGVPQAAPSSFGDESAAPTAAFAEYNPRTGEYVGRDGQLYQQSNLVTPAAKSWQDMLPK